jgi:hypothetical protein
MKILSGDFYFKALYGNKFKPPATGNWLLAKQAPFIYMAAVLSISCQKPEARSQ